MYDHSSENSIRNLMLEGGELHTKKIINFFKNLEYSPKKGISIHPIFMTFKEPSEGLYWRRRLTIKNTGVKAAEIGVLPPNSLVIFLFSLLHL